MLADQQEMMLRQPSNQQQKEAIAMLRLGVGLGGGEEAGAEAT